MFVRWPCSWLIIRFFIAAVCFLHAAVAAFSFILSIYFFATQANNKLLRWSCFVVALPRLVMFVIFVAWWFVVWALACEPLSSKERREVVVGVCGYIPYACAYYFVLGLLSTRCTESHSDLIVFYLPITSCLAFHYWKDHHIVDVLILYKSSRYGSSLLFFLLLFFFRELLSSFSPSQMKGAAPSVDFTAPREPLALWRDSR